MDDEILAKHKEQGSIFAHQVHVCPPNTAQHACGDVISPAAPAHGLSRCTRLCSCLTGVPQFQPPNKLATKRKGTLLYIRISDEWLEEARTIFIAFCAVCDPCRAPCTPVTVRGDWVCCGC